MDVVIDTDILSTFCKIDKLELLARLFRKSTIIISPSVYKEIRRAIRDGKLEYKPPPNFVTAKLTPSERTLAKEFLSRNSWESVTASAWQLLDTENASY